MSEEKFYKYKGPGMFLPGCRGLWLGAGQKVFARDVEENVAEITTFVDKYPIRLKSDEVIRVAKSCLQEVSENEDHDIYWYRKEIEYICNEHRWELRVRCTLMGIEVEVLNRTAPNQYYQIAFDKSKEASEDNIEVFKRIYEKLKKKVPAKKPEPISFQEDKDQGYIDKLHTLCNLNGLKMTIEKSFSDRLKVSFLNPDGSEAMSVTESPDKVYEYAFDHLNLSLKENGYKYYRGDAIWPYVEKEIGKFLDLDFKNLSDLIANDHNIKPDKSGFEKVLDEMADIHVKKNHDYGDSFTELYKECGSTYAYAHLKEKLSRIKTLRKSRQQVKQESLRDSLMDLASYSVMWIVELDKKGKEDERR